MSYRKYLMADDEPPSELYKAVELGTNLAEVGTDLISRQQAIDIAPKLIIKLDGYEMHNQAVANYCVEITQLQPAQPEIVTCDRCVATKLGECIWHNAGATYCSLGEVTT